MPSTPSDLAACTVIRMGTGAAAVGAAMIALCGEHAHRTSGLDHWYPMIRLDPIIDRLSSSDVYGATLGEILVATFAVSTEPLPYYGDLSSFHQPADSPMYLQALAVLPGHQGRGIGRLAMQSAEGIAMEAGCDALRFDAVTSNGPAMAFYRRLGYAKGGVIPVGSLTVTCFERRLEPGAPAARWARRHVAQGDETTR